MADFDAQRVAKGLRASAQSRLSVGLYVFFGVNMLTHEQTTIRLRDAEISRLRKDNERLADKVRTIKIGLIEIIRAIAKDMNFAYRTKLLDMAKELEQDV